jgi:hypothetical protein
MIDCDEDDGEDVLECGSARADWQLKAVGDAEETPKSTAAFQGIEMPMECKQLEER